MRDLLDEWRIRIEFWLTAELASLIYLWLFINIYNVISNLVPTNLKYLCCGFYVSLYIDFGKICFNYYRCHVQNSSYNIYNTGLDKLDNDTNKLP